MNEKLISRLRPLARKVRRFNVGLHHVFQNAFKLLGLNVVRVKDYYSPLPVLSDLRKNQSRWYRPSRMAGITYDLDAMRKKLSSLLAAYGAEYASQPSYDVNKRKGFGPGFTPLDAMVEYLMIRDIKPRRYIEVGSGLSTYYASLAAAKNAEERRAVKLTCVEPYPYDKLSTIAGIEIVQKEVQEVRMDVFGELGSGDILFLDSTHIVKIDGDVPYLILEVLPALNKGVIVHIHDVPFPYNIPYPPEQWIYGMPWPWYWTEAMLLQAFLCNNPDFRILLSTPLLRYYDEEFLRANIPGYKSVAEDPKTFCSLWLEKVG